MRFPTLSLASVTAAVVFTIATVTGIGVAAAQSNDYSTLPVDPNLITDSQAYTAAPLVLNPNGQAGVTAVYNHRDGGRQITSTILILPDAAAATAALNDAQAGKVANPQTQPAAVGSGGTIATGPSPDGAQSVSLLTFTQGNAAATIEFDGPPTDPAPTDLVLELGEKQDTAILDWQAA